MLTFSNARILAEDGLIPRGWLTVRDGLIAAFGMGDTPAHAEDGESIDLHGATLAPGFIDIHVHGGGGYEAMDATQESLDALSRFYAQQGVTGFLPTTWTASREAITTALTAIADHQISVTGARILGAHVEGPYINPSKPGAQSSLFIRRADLEEFEDWYQTGMIKLVTLAPEFAENLHLVELCTKHGIATSAGHTDATFVQMHDALERGLRATTHTFNAMRPLHHREPGTVGAALMLDRLRCEVIADGVHVHPAMVDLLLRAKSVDGMILITDAVRGAGLPEGATYTQDGRRVSVRDGSAYLDDGTLAGSTLTMDAALRNLTAFTGLDVAALWPCASLTPARAIGVDNITGSIRTGKQADLVVLSADLNVQMTVICGEIFE